MVRLTGWTGGVEICTAVVRMGSDNFLNTEGVGQGVVEYKLDFSSGYRIDFDRDGEQLVVLLAGGIKKQQSCFKTTVLERAQAKPEFRVSLFTL